jgi:hypothetical protein
MKNLEKQTTKQLKQIINSNQEISDSTPESLSNHPPSNNTKAVKTPKKDLHEINVQRKKDIEEAKQRVAEEKYQKKHGSNQPTEQEEKDQKLAELAKKYVGNLSPKKTTITSQNQRDEILRNFHDSPKATNKHETPEKLAQRYHPIIGEKPIRPLTAQDKYDQKLAQLVERHVGELHITPTRKHRDMKKLKEHYHVTVQDLFYNPRKTCKQESAERHQLEIAITAENIPSSSGQYADNATQEFRYYDPVKSLGQSINLQQPRSSEKTFFHKERAHNGPVLGQRSEIEESFNVGGKGKVGQDFAISLKEGERISRKGQAPNSEPEASNLQRKRFVDVPRSSPTASRLLNSNSTELSAKRRFEANNRSSIQFG